jgi:hypothetical protein
LSTFANKHGWLILGASHVHRASIRAMNDPHGLLI